ncbi:hypothetical protein DTW90_18965 [Neorhizobium sp. P12A]|uniref:hypothetical protein n=1 Tax=Neorhizobium sp. P12A TaxID=2268027 RepID=UPI0011EC0433|nr:hypothetical protein [Neorhizobium sp. P12A]KAA0697495.1 hypothetical protein DTW90_18965 [Neorhizobium sp. P12A]
MTISARIRVLLFAAIISAVGLDIGERLAIPGVSGIITVAEARIGRPLTPVSVAGVARRTARRCAAGVYYC